MTIDILSTEAGPVTSTASGPVTPDRFRQVFRRHPAGVVVITTDAGRGPAGFTATSLTSLSLEPALVSFGIASTASSWPHIRDADTAVVHFLGAEQQSVAQRFATSGIDRFGGPTRWSRLPGGEPVLDEAPGWLQVRIADIVTAGDHRIVIARVESSWLADLHRPLVYHDGRYHSLPSAPHPDLLLGADAS
ncbi:flavin reductase family protein [Streptomyces fildesensis]|uniref:Flavin reductase family protein n=1 Tax=Streptomyces fildesensis TaxID=375757 RepID=A0ABW8C300_9ACTN